jgi:hypothetical protein
VFAHFRVEGFPANEKLLLSAWTFSTEEKADSVNPLVLKINKSGELQTEKGSDFGIVFSEEEVGLTHMIGLATADGRVRTLLRVTPFPIEATAGPCRLFAEEMEPLGAAFRITATGFAPDDELKISATSKKKSDESTGKARSDGSWQGQVKMVIGSERAKQLKLTVTGKSCSVTVQLRRRKPPMPLPTTGILSP